ncbi:hypothetical protein CSUB01_12003 [Colletotrichum sublineola]|uniref:Uncharacterized protein n=1 Tax=Colletotrichum sublineola TaxID=1173701 RepID=A0A066WZU4_COLSU|nr:hypothetical protein CSUB01_12003 [Colletotrichum sublineola]
MNSFILSKSLVLLQRNDTTPFISTNESKHSAGLFPQDTIRPSPASPRDKRAGTPLGRRTGSTAPTCCALTRSSQSSSPGASPCLASQQSHLNAGFQNTQVVNDSLPVTIQSSRAEVNALLAQPNSQVTNIAAPTPYS